MNCRAARPASRSLTLAQRRKAAWAAFSNSRPLRVAISGSINWLPTTDELPAACDMLGKTAPSLEGADKTNAAIKTIDIARTSFFCSLFQNRTPSIFEPNTLRRKTQGKGPARGEPEASTSGLPEATCRQIS